MNEDQLFQAVEKAYANLIDAQYATCCDGIGDALRAYEAALLAAYKSVKGLGNAWEKAMMGDYSEAEEVVLKSGVTVYIPKPKP